MHGGRHKKGPSAVKTLFRPDVPRILYLGPIDRVVDPSVSAAALDVPEGPEQRYLSGLSGQVDFRQRRQVTKRVPGTNPPAKSPTKRTKKQQKHPAVNISKASASPSPALTRT